MPNIGSQTNFTAVPVQENVIRSNMASRGIKFLQTVPTKVLVHLNPGVQCGKELQKWDNAHSSCKDHNLVLRCHCMINPIEGSGVVGVELYLVVGG